MSPSAVEPEPSTHASLATREHGAKTLAILGYGVLWGERATAEFLEQALPFLQEEEETLDPKFARAFLLRRSLPLLLRLSKTLGKQLTPPEQIMLDALRPGTERLEQFDGFFHRLPAEDQTLLLLSDTLLMQSSELALAFHEPEASLLTRREQSLRALLDWIYAERNPAPTSPLNQTNDCFWIQSELFKPSHRSLSEAAALHLRECAACTQTQKRVQAILKYLNQPPSKQALQLAEQMKESLQTHSKRDGGATTAPPGHRLEKWKKKLTPTWAGLRPNRGPSQVPWHQRPTIRSWLGITSVLIILLTVPRLRALYETHLDRKLESYFAPAPIQLTPEELAQAMQKQADSSLSASTGPQPGSEEPTPDSLPSSSLSSGEDLEGEEAVEAEDEGETQQAPKEPTLRGGVWRFHLKTHSPRELRTQIVQYLKGVQVLNRGRGSDGIEAPGGIQFDFTIPKTALPALRDFLKATVENPGGPASTSRNKGRAALESAPFTWYRGKSAIPVPTGQAKVILWLSQI